MRLRTCALLVAIVHLGTESWVGAYHGASFETDGGASARWSYQHDPSEHEKFGGSDQRRRFGGHESQFDNPMSMLERIKRQAYKNKASTLKQVPPINLINALQLNQLTTLSAMQGDQKLAEALKLLPAAGAAPGWGGGPGNSGVDTRRDPADSRAMKLENDNADAVIAVINAADLTVPSMKLDDLAVETAVPTTVWMYQPDSCEPIDFTSFGHSIKVPEDAQEFNLPKAGMNKIPINRDTFLDASKPLILVMKKQFNSKDCPLMMRLNNAQSNIYGRFGDFSTQSPDSIAVTLLEAKLTNGKSLTMDILSAAKSQNPIPTAIYIAGTVSQIRLDEVRVLEDTISGATTIMIPDLTKEKYPRREPDPVEEPVSSWPN